MRRAVAGILLIAVALAASGCMRVEPDNATERAAAGAVIGATLGAGIGATVAIAPGIGAEIGAGSGALIGAAIGVATAQPTIVYAPIPVPSEPIVPEFYDTWPPGYHALPVGFQVAPPRPS
jgi:hypothetical protein